jgi:peptidoglycan/xylan/chitin deacetylase (PgdA/CDA1 family)
VKLSPFLRASAAIHAAALPALALAPRHWPWIVGAAVADHSAVIAGGLLPRSTLLGPNLRRSEAAALQGAVVLTFDDGPDPGVTPQVLDLLDARGARATFFCIGENASHHRDLAAEIARRGHRLENHSWSHRNAFFFHRPATLDREIGLCQDELERASGRRPSFFRAPAGIRSPLLEGALRRAGVRLVSWTRRGYDTVASDPDAVAARLTRGLAAGDLLVLHDGVRGARASATPIAVRVLPRILDALEGQGLRAVPLSDGTAAIA